MANKESNLPAVIPRQTIFYDIMDFLYHKKMTERLRKELPVLAKSPVNADMELRHIEVRPAFS